MAELIIKTFDSGGFLDNDIFEAKNDTYLLWQATQRIADHRKIGGDFFKPISSMAFGVMLATSRYMIEQLSRSEIKVTLLSDMSEEIKGPLPNENGNAIALTQYMERRMGPGKRAMFGNEDRAVWFEGQADITLANLENIWIDHITPETGLLADNHKKHHTYRTHFLKKFLVIVTTDFDNERRGELESPIENITPADPEDPDSKEIVDRIAERRHRVNWRSLPGKTPAMIAEIENRRLVHLPRREVIRPLESIVEAKP